MRNQSILCPVDFSENCRAAIEIAASLAKQRGGRLHVVHVMDAMVAGIGYVPPADLEATRHELKALVPAGVSIEVKHQLLVGDPASELLAYAKDHGVDLIVMGTHGRTGLSRLLMGSVAESVVRKSPCPVLTTKTPVSVSDESTSVGGLG